MLKFPNGQLFEYSITDSSKLFPETDKSVNSGTSEAEASRSDHGEQAQATVESVGSENQDRLTPSQDQIPDSKDNQTAPGDDAIQASKSVSPPQDGDHEEAEDDKQGWNF